MLSYHRQCKKKYFKIKNFYQIEVQEPIFSNIVQLAYDNGELTVQLR